MVVIERATPEDAPSLAAMEQDSQTREFIIPYSRERHLSNMRDQDLIYLRILIDGTLVGFCLLALESDQISVEFRRIVVATKGKMIGQTAIKLMESFCRATLGRSRIWLDVFAHNARGRHI